MVETSIQNDNSPTSSNIIKDDTSDLLSFNTGFAEQKKKEIQDRIQEQFQNNTLVVHVESPSDAKEIEELERETELKYAASSPSDFEDGHEPSRSKNHIMHQQQQNQQAYSTVDLDGGYDAEMLLEEGRAKHEENTHSISSRSRKRKYLLASLISVGIFLLIMFFVFIVTLA